MSTVQLQRVTPFDGQARAITGKVTGTLYTVNGLGQVTVDTRDEPYLTALGWIAIGGTGEPTSGVATINFGAFPGSPFATTTMEASPSTTSQNVNAWVMPIATADHSADEHVADPPRVSAYADGNGNVIIEGFPSGRDKPVPAGTAFGQTTTSQMPIATQQPMPYGAWSVGWAFVP